MRSHRRRRFGVALCGAFAWCAVTGSFAQAQVVTPLREVQVEHGVLGEVAVFAPPQGSSPRAFIIYLTDDDGSQLTAERRASVERLVAQGAAVAPLSARAVLDRLAARADTAATCLDAFEEFEDLSTLAQRTLGGANYRWPVLLGDGPTGGTLAYLALAQALVNTAAGAVSLAFSPALSSGLPICPGATSMATDNTHHIYAPSADVPGRWLLVARDRPSPEVEAFLRADDGNEFRLAPNAGPNAQLRTAEAAALELGAPPATSLGDLPLVEIPPRGHGPGDAVKAGTLAVFVSGDGGWRDIDKRIAEELAAQGVAVVGIDALRYFWRRKPPATVARDIERIIATYGQRWQVRRVALLGFSLGADALPLAWAQLGPATRDQVRLVALMGLGTTADLEVSVTGLLGVTSTQAVDARPALRTLPAERVLCFFGTDEKATGETGCLLPELAGATLVERPGGHHLSRDYGPVAKAILARLH